MTQGSSGQLASTAYLNFQIVIPPVLVLDTQTGTMYSNDTRTVALLGTLEGRRRCAPRRRRLPGWHWTAGRHLGARALPGGTGSRLASRGVAHGDVLCIP